MCPSGQWQKKFDVKSTKDLFTKWNGDMVPVQALYHRDYPLAIRLDADLKALVINSRHLLASKVSYEGAVKIQKTPISD